MRTHHLDINIDGSEGYHLGYLGPRFMQAPHHRTGHERGRIAIGALRIADMSVGILRTLVKSYMNTTRTLSCLV